MAKKLKIDGLLKKASDAVSRRNYGLAIFNYIEAVKLQPDDVDARLALRATQSRNVKENGAPGWKAYIALFMANIHKMLKKMDLAIIDCENGLTSDPSNLKLLNLLADLLEEEGHVNAAIWQRQSISDTVDPDDVGNLYSLADLYKDNGRAQEAIGCYERIRTIAPEEDVESLIREASAHLSSQIFQKAAKEGSRSVMKDSDETERLELDSGKLRNDTQRRKAINYRLENDLKERPDDYAIWINIGDIASQLDDFDAGYAEAKKYLSKAQELSPANSSIRDKLGDLEMKKARRDMQLLQAKVKAGDEQAKKDLLELRKADLKFQLGEFERRVKEQPLKADFHNRLGNIYMQFKRYDDAISELQLASRDPKFKIASLTNLGRCMLAQGNAKMAISQFEKARAGVELFEKYREPMYFEACAYQDIADAESLKKAHELFVTLYEVDINYKDVKSKVEELQKKLG